MHKSSLAFDVESPGAHRSNPPEENRFLPRCDSSGSEWILLWLCSVCKGTDCLFLFTFVFS